MPRTICLWNTDHRVQIVLDPPPSSPNDEGEHEIGIRELARARCYGAPSTNTIEILVVDGRRRGCRNALLNPDGSVC
jgi:hypothetical protein